MGLDKSKFGMVDNALYTLLTAGICGNCKVPKMINTGGDGVHEPAYEELYLQEKGNVCRTATTRRPSKRMRWF